jgi:Cu/Ag efflux protein CusF
MLWWSVYVSLTPRRIVLLAASLVTIAVACVEGWETPSTSTSTPDYQGTGVIVGLHPPPSSLHPTRPVVVLRHDPIVGLMDESMEMPFIAASTALFAGLKPGDHVEFGLKTTPDALLVIFLRRAPPRPR